MGGDLLLPRHPAGGLLLLQARHYLTHSTPALCGRPLSLDGTKIEHEFFENELRRRGYTAEAYDYCTK